MRAAFAWVSRAAIVLLVAGCASSGPRTTTASVPETNEHPLVDVTPATLTVENGSIYDVRVFVIRAGQFTRLGTVTTMSSGDFQLSPYLIDREVVLYADPVGGRRRLRADAIRIWPGQHVELRLERQLRSYSLAVY